MRPIRSLAIGAVIAVAVTLSIVAIDPALVQRRTTNQAAPALGSENSGHMATTTDSGIPPGAPIGGPFQLTNQLGHRVSDTTYQGKYMLVFFGYSHCPDECPLTLQKIALTMTALGPLAPRTAPIFITIDPARDTPPVLKSYLSKFGTGLIGLTGTNAQIASVAREYAVTFDANDPESAGASVISHSTYIYLMGPNGKFLNLFPFTITVAQLTSVLRGQISQ